MIDAAIARVLLEASLRVCVVAAAVAGILRLTRVQSSSVRHAAWAFVVAAMLLMPLLPYVLPSFELPGRSSVAATIAGVPDELPYVGDVDLMAMVGNSAATDPAVPNGDAASVVAGESASVVPALPLWLGAAIAIYAIGLAMLLIRWLFAARFIAKLCRDSVPIAAAHGVFESALAATPITVGVLRPRIVLPPEWKTWSREKLAGVLAHERAHVARHDPLVAVVAYVNRCIFWFHPLSWWLERKLAATAEDAADDAGVRAMGQEREYAEVLVEMAAIVRSHGGRVAWQGVGVDGNGLLGKRIDRLLSGYLFREVSPMKKMVIALVSTTAVVVAVACRPHVEPAPLTPDPKVAERLASNQASSDEFNQAKALTKEGAEALEAKVRANPEDLDSRRTLLYFYRLIGWKVAGTEATIRNRRAHVLWMIEHKPEDSLMAFDWGYLPPAGDLADPEGHEQARRLWLVQADAKAPSAEVLARAATCLSRAGDLPEAEAALKRGAALYPTNARWSGLLSGVYADAMAGVTPPALNARSSTDPLKRTSPYAMAVRKRLESTTDAILLANVATAVDRVSHGPSGTDAALSQLARGYADRAFALDPSSFRVAMAVRTFREQDRRLRWIEWLKSTPNDPAKRLDALLALSTDRQFEMLPSVADTWDMQGEAADYRHDAAGAKAYWDASKRAATALLALAPQFRTDPDYGPNIFRVNCVLGLSALRAGNRAESVKYLAAAADAPPSPNFGLGTMPSRHSYLANYLLKYGERESVASFYEKYGKRLVPDDPSRQRMFDNAAAIRAGRMPEDYQRFFAAVDNAPKK